MDLFSRSHHLNRSARSCSMNLLLVLFTILVVLNTPAQCCPPECACSNNKVNCAGKGMTSLPASLPAGTTELIFSNNNLKSLGSRAFFNYAGSLEILDLSHNNIKTVALDAFDSLFSLRKLYLQENNITTIQSKSFKDFVNVDEINISQNPLGLYPKGVFESCTKLSILKITDANLDEKAFEAMKNVRFLEFLDISGNNFTHLPYLMLESYNRLGHLIINDASIQSIDPNAFVGLRSLRYLKLVNNKLTRLNRETFQPLELVNLDLQGNKLACDCGISQFKDWKAIGGVILIGRLTCMDADGKEYELENDDLSKFCKGGSPPINTNPCQGQGQIILHLVEVSHNHAVVRWKTRSVPSNTTLSVNLRIYDREESGRWEDMMAATKSHTFTKLIQSSDYILCVLQPQCGLYTCVDFATLRDPQLGAVKEATCVPVEVTAGVAAAAAFAMLTFGMITVYLVLKGVCCCPTPQTDDKDSSEGSFVNIPGPAKRTQHVIPLQLSQSYAPSSPPRLQSTSSVGDTYDAIPLEPVEVDSSGKIFYNPSYRRKERPRHANDPLPVPGSTSDPTNKSSAGRGIGSPGDPQIIQGIASAYLHPTQDQEVPPATFGSGHKPEPYLQPTETLQRRPSKHAPADPTLRHTMNAPLSNSDPYHVYQEANDNDVLSDLNSPRPRSSEDQPSPTSAKKQFAQRAPTLDEIRHQMETGTGRMKKFRRPALQDASRSISTPDILASEERL